MKVKEVLKKQIQVVKPTEEIINKINQVSREFITELEKKLKSKNINAEVFIGGSIAKKTLVKKDKYDVDVFVRFDKKYKDDEISILLGKILGNTAERIHGSRDYYHLIKKEVIIEVIPIIKIKKPDEALNVTDLSYFHVNYVLRKIKADKKLADEIIIAKAFCHAQDCYGAESYINGFSGYALELLICHYGSFLNFIKEVVNSKENEKIIIDDSKFYKKKQDVLVEVNEAKISSPIILIDPTFKERNALASLSLQTFKKFKEACKNFLKKPSSSFFEKKDVFFELNKRYGEKIRIVSIKTNKQAGDIAGTKSKKFFGFFLMNLKKEFNVKESEFYYDDKKNIAYFYLVLDKKPEEIIKGPPITNIHGLTGFKKAHKDAFIKNQVSYAKLLHNMNFSEFFEKFLKRDKDIIKDMSIKEMKIVK
jgi:tRNA nucleotidyltransferase (CCA-adding enzyme)